MPEIQRRPASARGDREAEIQHAIRERLGVEPDLVLWRQSIANVEVWDETTGRSRRHHAGLPRGSADLIGILRQRVRLVGEPCAVTDLGRLFALEVKAPAGRLSDEQREWGELVRRFGGFYAVVRSVDEAMAALDRARRGACA